jgi:hypothetical protein
LVEKCQARKMNVQAAYICVCLCSFAKVEKVRQQKRISVTELFKRLHREPRHISKNPEGTWFYGTTMRFG